MSASPPPTIPGLTNCDTIEKSLCHPRQISTTLRSTVAAQDPMMPKSELKPSLLEPQRQRHRHISFLYQRRSRCAQSAR